MSFKSWIVGVLPAVWIAFKALLFSELARVAADPQTQALAKKAVVLAATYVKENGPDQKFEIAVRGLRQDFKDLGKDLCLGWASTIIQQAFELAKAEDPASIGKTAATPDSNAPK